MIKGVLLAAWRRSPAPPPHVVTSAVEHCAVLDAISWCEAYGFAVATRVPVSTAGVVDLPAMLAAITPHTALVSLQLANNETGALQPVAELSQALTAAATAGTPRPLLHCDASQAVGKIPVSFRALGVDAMSLAGHKLYAPKGVGATLLAGGPSSPAWGGGVLSLLSGGGQERGLRAGTENVVGIAGLGAAAQWVGQLLREGAVGRMAALRARLLSSLASLNPTIHGPSAGALKAGDTTWDGATLPNTLSVAFPGALSGALVDALRDRVAISAGSACHSHGAAVSGVLSAMQVPRDLATCTVRLSLGAWSTEEEVDAAGKAIVAAVDSLRGPAAVAAAAPASVGPDHPPAPPADCPASVLARLFAASPSPNKPSTDLTTVPLYLEDTSLVTNTAVLLGVAARQEDGSFVLVSADGGIVAGVVGPGVPGADIALILSATVAHPQGGGQPSDFGHIAVGDHVLPLLGARAGAGPAAGCVLHFVAAPGNVLPAVAAGVGAPATVTLDAPHRALSARLHSAGHLLDVAFREVHTELAFPGWSLPKPSKGYHFIDGPFVEYLGDFPAPVRAEFAARLGAACARLVAADVATRVQNVVNSPAALQSAGLEPGDVSHLPPGAPVRIVRVAGNACPCGGTHVSRAGEIGRLTVGKIDAKKGTIKVRYTLA